MYVKRSVYIKSKMGGASVGRLESAPIPPFFITGDSQEFIISIEPL